VKFANGKGDDRSHVRTSTCHGYNERRSAVPRLGSATGVKDSSRERVPEPPSIQTVPSSGEYRYIDIGIAVRICSSRHDRTIIEELDSHL